MFKEYIENTRPKYIRELFSKFEDIGSICSKQAHESRMLNEATQIDVNVQFDMNP